jgi:hypothetical protein
MKLDVRCEFGYELLLILPYAYYLHKHDKLESTTSTMYTKELYYFSKDHTEKYTTRDYKIYDNIPNKNLHTKNFDYSMYLPPPYKEVFKNDEFFYDKPLLIIQNKYNKEWNQSPINFIDLKTLDTIFSICKDKYTIIYNRPQAKNIIGDNSDVYDLNESDIIRKHGVIEANVLYEKYREKYNFNHFQLLLHANCDHFISVQGGTSVICSYFGGTNIIFAKRGGEVTNGLYKTLFTKLSNATIFETNNYTELIDLVKEKYLK